MSDEVQQNADEYPAYPVKTPGMNAFAYSKALAEHHKAGVAWMERHPEKGYRQHETGSTVSVAAPAAVTAADPDDLAQLQRLQAQALKGPMNPQVNKLIFDGFVKLQKGERLDMEALEQQWSAATATKADHDTAKAIEAFTPLIAADGSAEGGQIPAQLRSGYDLPKGQRFAVEETVRLLATAKQLGLRQDQVDEFIRLQDEE